MTITVQAIYEQGVLRLVEPIFLEEGTHVEVIVIAKELQLVEKTPAEILGQIAAMPLESSDNDELSNRDHDKILYS
jgi:predicted DNA-binding antitoxin AbrB/MazE fold protein